jgi:hypothetical protein
MFHMNKPMSSHHLGFDLFYRWVDIVLSIGHIFTLVKVIVTNLTWVDFVFQIFWFHEVAMIVVVQAPLP